MRDEIGRERSLQAVPEREQRLTLVRHVVAGEIGGRSARRRVEPEPVIGQYRRAADIGVRVRVPEPVADACPGPLVRPDQRRRPTGIGEAVLFDEGDGRRRRPFQSDPAGLRPLGDIGPGDDVDPSLGRRGQASPVLRPEVDDDDLQLVKRSLRAEAVERVLCPLAAVTRDHHDAEARPARRHAREPRSERAASQAKPAAFAACHTATSATPTPALPFARASRGSEA